MHECYFCKNNSISLFFNLRPAEPLKLNLSIVPRPSFMFTDHCVIPNNLICPNTRLIVFLRDLGARPYVFSLLLLGQEI